ncbi:unnamed protein product [Timema podura]|uniref:Uncharacterized protein n=1 Tax=Timema podura TaxID=61482 RepID=A0ABN7PFK2_TIMPD|nr:unnamed protein product [Timema podura]
MPSSRAPFTRPYSDCLCR